MEITFLENTLIRTSIESSSLLENNFQNHVLGYIRQGKTIEVLNDTRQSRVSITDKVNNTLVTSNKWFKDNNGWFYWYGSTDVGFEKISTKPKKFSRQNQIDISTIDLDNLNSYTIPEPITNNNIIDTFWKKGIYGQDVNVAVLDSGYTSEYDNIADFKFDRRGVDLGLPFIDENNHGGKCLALIKYCSNSYIGLSPKANLFFFQIKPSFSVDYEDVALTLTSAIEECKQKGIHIINISQALNKRKVSDNTYDRLQKAINNFSSDGIIICSGGNNGLVGWEKIVPAHCDNVITVSSFSYRNNKIKNNSLFYPRVDFRIENSRVVMPDNSIFGNSSCSAVLMTSYLSLVISMLGLSKLKIIKDRLGTYNPGNRVFSITNFINHIT